jgi:hypothetical protein
VTYRERVSYRPGKLERLDMALNRWDPFDPLPSRKRTTKADRERDRHRWRGRHWRFRNRQILRQLNWDRRRYGA